MKGICFIEPMLLMAAKGEKTQTRRIIFPDTDYTFWSQPTFEGIEKDPSDVYRLDKDGEIACDKYGEPKLRTLKGTYALFEGDQFPHDNSYVKPRYQPGETVYLKEPYFVWEPEHCSCMDKRFAYKYGISADIEAFRKDEFKAGYTQYKWHNKLYMPEKAARYFIRIKDVQVEKLLDISEEDAIKEGVDFDYTIEDGRSYVNYMAKKVNGKMIAEIDNARTSYLSLWCKINGSDSHLQNPWVYVYIFELSSKPV